MAALWLAAGGCGAGPAPQPVAVDAGDESRSPEPLASAGLFIPGEQMGFRLALRGVLVGEAVVAVGEPGEVDGREIVIIRSRVESAGVAAVLKEVRDDVTSWVDLASGRPIYYQADLKFGDKTALIETRFNGGGPGSFLVRHGPSGELTRMFRQTVPAQHAAFDGHAVIGGLRAWDAPEGALAEFFVLAGRRTWHNTVRMTGREEKKTALGRFTARRIDGVARRMTPTLAEDPGRKPRSYTVWISDDEERLPLLVTGKTEYGDVSAELVTYKHPDRPALTRR